MKLIESIILYLINLISTLLYIYVLIISNDSEHDNVRLIKYYYRNESVKKRR